MLAVCQKTKHYISNNCVIPRHGYVKEANASMLFKKIMILLVFFHICIFHFKTRIKLFWNGKPAAEETLICQSTLATPYFSLTNSYKGKSTSIYNPSDDALYWIQRKKIQFSSRNLVFKPNEAINYGDVFL